MVRALAARGPEGRRGDRVVVLAASTEAALSARDAVGGCAEVIEVPFGDIWLRDAGPALPASTRQRRDPQEKR